MARWPVASGLVASVAGSVASSQWPVAQWPVSAGVLRAGLTRWLVLQLLEESYTRGGRATLHLGRREGQVEPRTSNRTFRTF